MWGVMGVMVACCVLWVLLSVGGEPVDFVLRHSRSFLLRFGFSSSYLTEVAVLHLQFAGLGFIVGSGFRLLGLRKKTHRHDNAA
jgi:hypothetical protein